jgi:hypothetical protein
VEMVLKYQSKYNRKGTNKGELAAFIAFAQVCAALRCSALSEPAYHLSPICVFVMCDFALFSCVMWW